MNTYFELASQYPQLLANIGQSFAQSFDSGRRAKIAEHEMNLRQQEHDQALSARQEFLGAQQGLADSQSDAGNQAVAADQQATTQAQGLSQQAQQRFSQAQARLAMYDPQAANAMNQSAQARREQAMFEPRLQAERASANKAQFESQRQMMGQQAQSNLALLNTAKAHPQAWPSISKALGVQGDASQIDDLIAHQATVLDSVSDAPKFNAVLEEAANSLGYVTPGDRAQHMAEIVAQGQKLQALKDQEQRNKTVTSSPEFEREKYRLLSPGSVNQGLGKGVAEHQQGEQIEAKGLLGAISNIRSQFKSDANPNGVDLPRLNSLVGGAGHKWDEFKSGVNPDWVKPEDQAALSAAATLRDDIDSLALESRKEAGVARALGDEKKAKALESAIINSKNIGPNLEGQLRSLEAAANRKVEATATSLGQGVTVHAAPKPQTADEKAALERYRRIKANGASHEQATAAAIGK